MMRSLLFVPGDDARKLEKAGAAGADALIIDLEDSVAAPAKPQARARTAAYLEARPPDSPGRTPLLAVRINPLDGPFWEDDLAAIIPARPDFVMLPKATPDGVMRLAAVLDAMEAEAGLPAGAIRILTVSTETPTALLAMEGYRHCPARLAGLSWGAEDLAAELGATTNRRADGVYTDPFRLARTLTLIAARAAGVLAIDSVYTNFRDAAGLRAELAEALRDSFDAKLAIHPAQVPIINEALTPTPGQVDAARRIVAAFEANPDAGVLSLDGRMIDLPHLKQARRVLARAGRRP